MSAPDQFSLKIASRREEMPRLIGMLNDLRAIGRIPEDICNAFCVVTDEVVNNLLTHALQGSPDYEIGFTVQVYPQRIELEISDDGPSFNPIECDDPPLDAGVDNLPVGGLGLHLAKSLVDAMLYLHHDGRNLLRVVRNLLASDRNPADSEGEFSAGRGTDRRHRRNSEVVFPMIVRGQRLEHDRRQGDRRLRNLAGHVWLFRGVDSPELDRILADCPLLELAETRVLLRKGEKNTNLYILLSGELQVQLDLNDPSPIIIGPGESVGEISLIDGEPTSAYVVAQRGSRLIVVADHIFWEQIIPLPGVARNLMRAQTKRMRANNEAILDKLAHELQLKQMEKDLAIAADIQNGMLPRRFPLFPDRPEIDLYATMRPAREVGGDFYDAFLTDRGQLLFALGDVSGKGVAAALFMVRSMTLLRTEARHSKGPLEMLHRMNRLLCEENPQSMFVTLCLVLLDLDTGRLRVGNAGHLPPVIGKDGDWRLLEPAPSSLLGVWDEARFAETELMLGVGQTLLLYSDGVTEAHLPERVQHFGEARLRDCLRGSAASAQDAVRRVVAAVSDYAAGDEPFDDIAVLAFCFKGVPPAGGGR